MTQVNIIEPRAESVTSLDSKTEYAELLQFNGLTYRKLEYYLQVGEITKTQGWILHLSVVISQIYDLLELVIPFLAIKNAPFKIVIHELAGEDLLNGNLGLAQIGKIVSIYPENEVAALLLAKELVQLTQPFKGPSIPTDICLGNVVYTRFGSFNPVIKMDKNGNDEKYIYDGDGELIKDPYAIPFEMPKGVDWPFKELAEPVLPPSPKYFNRIYKVLDVLKADPRGNVFKGLYVKSLLQVKNCVLKQGFNNSASDRAGRDMRDRLVWQAELYKELADTIPMPAIYDLIHEEHFTLLIMEYLNADSLYQVTQELNPFSKRFQDLSIKDSLKLLHYAAEITLIINNMHKKGYVHRDIVPVNFLIDKRDKISLIDIELAYSFRHCHPNPPFTLGTPGFMSPEQEAQQAPELSQDIFSLGATLLCLFTGLTPIKFNTRDRKSLSGSLYFFIGNRKFATLVADCLQHDPLKRPSCKDILGQLHEYIEIKKNATSTPHLSTQKLDVTQLEQTILWALKGLTHPPIMSIDDLWYSKRISIENYSSPSNRQYSKHPGLGKGICGPLYMLARLHQAGINIDACKSRFMKGWKFIEETSLTHISELSPGLYKGAAGMAVALSEGIHSGLLENTESRREKILNSLELKNDEINLVEGISGQGVAILKCRYLLQKENLSFLLSALVDRLLSTHQKDGSWLNLSISKKRKITKLFDFSHDDTGILWFLLEYNSLYPNTEVQNAIHRALDHLLSNKKQMRCFHDLIGTRPSYEQGDGGKGMILLLLKAYEVLQNDIYKKLAENALLKFPACIVNSNLSQQNGLAGIGELYLEAWKVLKDEEWKIRADWIANVFLHSFFRNENGSGYWMMEQNSAPTADFISDISGIIHFLARCHNPDKIGYRLLK